MSEVPVSLYFTAEWWDAAYHADKPRPEVPSQQALEEMYLGRLKFLHRHFGEWRIGEERPALSGGQIATVLRYGYDLIPALLDTKLEFADAWGFFPVTRSLDAVRDLQPVNIASHPEGDWILQEQARLKSLYGSCSHCVDLASVTNHAFRILGQDVYTELIGDPAGLRQLFEVLLETMRYCYVFLADHFGGMDPVPMGNCNVSLMGPSLYQEHILAFDARQNRFATELNGAAPRAALHHCDVPADDFLDAYAHLPGVASLQASFASDVAEARRKLPGSTFSAMISPSSLMGDLRHFSEKLDRAVAAGAADLAMWNVDASTNVRQLGEVFRIISETCRLHGHEANFSPMPLCWEEIEWAHRRYQS
jgi:hypothetical protein